jgi:adenylate cyclase
MTSETRMEEQWRLLVVEGQMPAGRQRLAGYYALLPARARCRLCKVPFSGASGRLMRALGKTQSNLNPHLCSACDSFFRLNPGGIEVRLSMVFADIRGSTGLAEGMKPAEYMKLIDRFYATATEVLCKYEAMIDKLAGDQVSAYFIPGLVGAGHPQAAVEAARELLRATGHGSPGGPWIPVGIGVHTGEAFFGSVGARGGIVDMTALGDAVNVTARLASQAGPGEILVSLETAGEAGLEAEDAEERELSLKGRSQSMQVVVLRENN